MTRQKCSKVESLNRILRLFQNKPVPTDEPNTVSGDVLSEDEALSDLTELLGGSLPNETATLPPAITVPASNIPAGSFSTPSHTHPTYDTRYYDDGVLLATGTVLSIVGGNFTPIVSGTSVFLLFNDNPSFTTLRVGTSPNYAYIESDGTFRLTGSATAWEDLRIDGLSARVGVTAPTDEVGWRGDNNFLARNFVHTQADEIQFQVQMPHAWLLGSDISPHVHLSPWITGTQAVQAVQFIFEYYWANIGETFPVSGTSITLSYTWTGSKQWDHILCDHISSDIVGTGKSLSSIMKCRLYRDNTVANNLAGKVTFLYTDLHYQVDGLGSNLEYIK